MHAAQTVCAALSLALAYMARKDKRKRMNKEQTRALLGQLISLQSMIREMEENGFSWDKMQSIKDNLRLMIIDIEKALD